MDIKRFKEELPNLLLNSSGDNAFANLRIATHGMAGVRTAKILNFACRCMDKGEFYAEVGTFSGFTLVSAGYQLNAPCFGIDDFSMREVIKPEALEQSKHLIRGMLQKNIQIYGSLNTKFIEADFRNVQFEGESKGQLAVLFIDGEHTYKEVKETMQKFSPYLSKNALIIFDDVQFEKIPDYLIEMQKEYELLAYLVSSLSDHDRTFHMGMCLDEHIANGICVMTRKDVSSVANS